MWLGTVLIHTLLIYCRSVFLQRTFSSLSQICHKLSLCRGYPIGFFNPVIPTQNFVQSRNPEGYFWHPTSQAYFQSRDSPRFYFQIPNPDFKKAPIRAKQLSMAATARVIWLCACVRYWPGRGLVYVCPLLCVETNKHVVWKQGRRGVLSLIVISVFNSRKEAIYILTFIQAIST